MSTPVRIILIIVLALALFYLVTRLARNVADEETGATIAPATTLASRGPTPITETLLPARSS
jgi:hypothetical protein